MPRDVATGLIFAVLCIGVGFAQVFVRPEEVAWTFFAGLALALPLAWLLARIIVRSPYSVKPV